MNDLQYKIRRINTEDIPQALMLKEEAGWDPTRPDWKLFLGSPNICLVANIPAYQEKLFYWMISKGSMCTVSLLGGTTEKNKARRKRKKQYLTAGPAYV